MRPNERKTCDDNEYKLQLDLKWRSQTQRQKKEVRQIERVVRQIQYGWERKMNEQKEPNRELILEWLYSEI